MTLVARQTPKVIGLVFADSWKITIGTTKMETSTLDEFAVGLRMALKMRVLANPDALEMAKTENDCVAKGAECGLVRGECG